MTDQPNKSPLSDQLQPHRESIDRIDRELLRLINERLDHAVSIGRIKHASGADYFDPAREAEVLARIVGLNQDSRLPEKAVRSIYREIISASIGLEKQLVIAYLGPPATFTHQAAIKSFGSSLGYSPQRTIADVFAEVEREDAQYGVIPIENSTDGAVSHSLDMLVESDLKIVSQLYLPIEHCLISNEPLEAIREVHSKDQALGQCRAWLRAHVPNAVLVDNHSTAASVEIARDKPGTAAIASALAADLYGVPIAVRGIQDRSDNVTRFLTIGKNNVRALGGGKDKTSLVISINDRAGALQEALRPFSELSLNLTKIESRPSRRRPWDYIFFVDLVGHIDDPDVAAAIARLRESCPMVKWLGSYPNT